MMEEREGRSASSATLNNNNKSIEIHQFIENRSFRESDEQFEQPQFLAGPSQATDILFVNEFTPSTQLQAWKHL